LRAKAKINLSLHINGRRSDGYHELESLVAFAGIGDNLTFEPNSELSLVISGPFASFCGEPEANLIIRAALAFQSHFGDVELGKFHLIKRLPVASGMGGGSADAAAALRLLASTHAISIDDPRLLAAAREVGADVPVCLISQARMMRGAGERLDKPLKLPPLFAVLVNPAIPVSTAAVFAKIGLRQGEMQILAAHPEIIETDFDQTVRLLKKSRNDMEDAASVIAPVIGHVLSVLLAARGCRLARMSGSGATCFALFESCRQAAVAAKVIRRDHPGWWVKATVLR